LAAGTLLMDGGRTVAIDLPQKLLITESDEDSVEVAFNDPSYLAERNGLDPDLPQVEAIRGVLEEIVVEATGTG
jgi:uncharacterized protein (DUF302 family)